MIVMANQAFTKTKAEREQIQIAGSVKIIIAKNIGSMGSGSDSAGNFLDILTAKFEDGQTTTYYFVIDHAFKKMSVGKGIDKLLPPL